MESKVTKMFYRFRCAYTRLAIFGVALLCVVSAAVGVSWHSQALGINLVANPSAETVNTRNTALPQSWSKNKWGTNTASFAYKTGSASEGTRSLRVTISSYTSGDAKWVFAPVSVKPSTAYTFSDYYKSNVSTEYVAGYADTAGTMSYVWIGSAPAKSAWTQQSYTFTTPANVKTMTMYHVLDSVGWLETDNYSVATTNDPPAVPDPTLNITNPAEGSIIKGLVNLSGTATYSAGVTFAVDGTTVGTEDTTAPYTVSWDSTKVTDGAHTLTAVARGTNGKTLTATRQFTVANNPATPPPPPPATSNLIQNPSLETANGTLPQAWNKNAWGTNTAAFTYNTTGYSGTRSVTTTMSAHTSGDAKWYHSPVAVTPGQKYTYSDYYKSDVTTYVVAELKSTAGTLSYVDLVAAPASTTWRAYTGELTVPAGISSVTMYHLIASVGYLTMDDASLGVSGTVTPPVDPPTPPPATGNLVPNSSVETSASGTAPDSWSSNAWGTNRATFSYVSEGHTGSRSVRVDMADYTNGDAKWYFNPVAAPAGQYRLSAWYKGNVQPELNLMVTMQDGTTRYIWMAAPAPATNVWQQHTATVAVPAGAQALTIIMVIKSNGWLQTDDMGLTQYTPAGFNEGLVTLTFDDGWQTVFTNGLPVLNKYGYKTTQYLLSGYLDSPGYMTKAQAAAFAQNGHEIGSHTITHPHLTQLSPADLANELGSSQSRLRALFGASAATNFASPYGEYNGTTVAAIKQYYGSHRSVDQGLNSKDAFDRYNIHMHEVQVNTTLAEVKAWIDSAKSQKAWLVLLYHKVENAPAANDTYAVKTADLDAQLAYVQTQDIRVLTLQQALDTITPQL